MAKNVLYCWASTWPTELDDKDEYISMKLEKNKNAYVIDNLLVYSYEKAVSWRKFYIDRKTYDYEGITYQEWKDEDGYISATEAQEYSLEELIQFKEHMQWTDAEKQAIIREYNRLNG